MSDADIPTFELHHYKAITAIYATIFVLGFLCNTFVLVVFLATSTLRNSSNNFLLISMTFADWTMAVLSSSVGAYANSKYWWTLGSGVCQYFGFISSLAGYSSMGHITALAVEKWYTLKMARSGEISKQTMLVVVALLWIFSFLWALFPLVGWSSYAPEPGYAGCSIAWYSNTTSNKSFIICLFVFFFFVPMCVTIFCFGSIYLEVRKLAINATQRWGSSSGSTQQTIQAKVKTIRMSLAMVLAFLVAWTPYAVVSLHSSFIANDLPPAFTTLPAMFAKLSTFYNPIIYFFMYTRFRNAAKRLLIKKRIFPTGEDSSTLQSNNGSFMTSFPNPARFFQRMSMRKSTDATGRSTRDSIDRSTSAPKNTADDYVIERLQFPPNKPDLLPLPRQPNVVVTVASCSGT